MLDKILPYADAISFILEKTQVPSSWDSADWAEQGADIRVRSFFSARVENARFLDRMQGFLFDFMAGTTEEVVSPEGEKVRIPRANGRAEFIKQMREFMLSEGMLSPEEMENVNNSTVTDIASISRLGLIFDTNMQQAYGYADWRQSMKPAILHAFPAARLIRTREVATPRPRHQENLGEVRLKADEWWASYINDRKIGGFEVPWGPYGFNSGVDQISVPRREAKALGLLEGENQPAPKDSEPIPQDLPNLSDENVASVKRMDPDIKQKLIDELKAGIASRPRKSAKDAATEMIRKKRIREEGGVIRMD